jgi:hypothetical protein
LRYQFLPLIGDLHMAKVHPSRLTQILEALRSEYHKLSERLGELHATFQHLGIDPQHAPHGRGPGRPKSAATPASKPKRRRRRRRFAESADAFLLSLLKAKPLTTAEVNAAWKAAGRGGVANNALTTLTKSKKIKRQAVKGERGSRYSAA